MAALRPLGDPGLAAITVRRSGMERDFLLLVVIRWLWTMCWGMADAFCGDGSQWVTAARRFNPDQLQPVDICNGASIRSSRRFVNFQWMKRVFSVG